MEMLPKNRQNQATQGKVAFSILRAVTFLVLGLLLIAGCINDEPSPDDLFKANNPPIADAGTDQAVERGATVLLDGSKSLDPDGTDISFGWRIVELPEGSNAILSNTSTQTTSFVADVDGLYRVELIVGEIVDSTIPAGIPGAGEAGAQSEADESIVFAGAPGPFENSGNKLLLDGSHFGTTLLPMDVGGSRDLTAEAWVWIAGIPTDKEVFLFGKENVFELVLRTDATLVFRWFTGSGSFETAPVSVSVQTWHHIAGVINRLISLGSLALDGQILATTAATVDMNTNINRFNIGGGRSGLGLLVGMVDEVRVTDNVRYETDFDPPLIPLIGDTPFVENFQNTVHGLWHFDELAGVILFRDVSLRNNDLFFVGLTGFRPLTRMLHARLGHTAVILDPSGPNKRIFIAGGIDDGAVPVVETETIDTNDLVSSDASLLIETEKVIPVVDEIIGRGDGTIIEFKDIFLRFPPIENSLTITAGSVTATDNGSGTLSGTGITTGGVNYTTGEMNVTFDTAPVEDLSILAGYNYNLTSGISEHTATVLNDGTVLFAGGGGDLEAVERVPQKVVSLYDPTPDPATITTVVPLPDARRFHSAGILTGGKVLIVGGEDIDSNGDIITLSSNELYDPISIPKKVLSEDPLKEARRLHEMIRIADCTGLPGDNDRYLITGGYGTTHVSLASAEIYDPAKNPSFQLTGSMVKRRRRHTMTCLADKTILVTGGIDDTGRVLDTAEIYDPTTGLFTAIESKIIFPRAEHSATLLTDGKVLLIGGIDSDSKPLPVAELYDPVRKVFSPLISTQLAFGRFGHVALPWKTGVIVIGGGNSQGKAIPLVEFYLP